VKRALKPLGSVTLQFGWPAQVRGCIPRVLGIRWFGNARQPYRLDLAWIGLRRHGLLQYGYRPALQGCDSWEVAYMLCSINATSTGKNRATSVIRNTCWKKSRPIGQRRLANNQLTDAKNAPITIRSKPSQLTFEYFSLRIITAKITANGMLSLSIGAILEMLPI